MHTFFWVFIALAFSLLLFSSIQNEIPDELSFLKGNSSLDAGAIPPGAQKFLYLGWQVVESPGTAEFVKRAQGSLEVNDAKYTTPLVGILCHQGRLSVRIDPMYATTGSPYTLVGVSSLQQNFEKGASGTNLLATDPSSLVRVMAQSKEPVQLAISYRDFGIQRTALDASGLAQLLERVPSTCR